MELEAPNKSDAVSVDERKLVPDQPGWLATDTPLPILTGAEYRFLRFAVDLVDALAADSALGASEAVGSQKGVPDGRALARTRTALWLFERFPPSRDSA